MALTTTTIGAYPKPGYVKLPDWFNAEGGPDNAHPTRSWAAALEELGPNAGEIIARGVREVVRDQVEAGVDIPTDGEIPRENYVHYHCRHLAGVDFENVTRVSLRNGAYVANLPTIAGPVRARDRFLAADWRAAQAATEQPVKLTLPGPMTIADTTADAHYGDPARLGAALADALNAEVVDLAAAGCRHIQIDEPLFARHADEALAYGIENLERAFHGCPGHVTRTVHICCGYPNRLDNPDYPKAPRAAYGRLADALDQAGVDAVSIEDAHRPNDLALLEQFSRTIVVLGVVAIANSQIESAPAIQARLEEALQHIDAARLVAAPDCGLGLLGRDLARAKLGNLCQAARAIS